MTWPGAIGQASVSWAGNGTLVLFYITVVSLDCVLHLDVALSLLGEVIW